MQNAPLELLETLKGVCAEATENLLLPVQGENSKDIPEPRAPKIYGMFVPKKGDETKQIPYIIVIVQSGHDEQKPNSKPTSWCGVRIVAAVYNTDAGAGRLDLLNVLTRLRIELLQHKVLGNQFALRDEADWAIDPAYTGDYHFGEILTSYDTTPIYPKGVDEYIECPDQQM